MQKLVCWTLMGLRTLGGREVWYQLGTFQSESSAAESATSPYWTSQGFQSLSVVPYYRVEHNVAPHRTKSAADAREPVTARDGQTAV